MTVVAKCNLFVLEITAPITSPQNATSLWAKPTLIDNLFNSADHPKTRFSEASVSGTPLWVSLLNKCLHSVKTPKNPERPHQHQRMVRLDAPCRSVSGSMCEFTFLNWMAAKFWMRTSTRCQLYARLPKFLTALRH